MVRSRQSRTLALLRCVGATKAQVGRGVLAEAAILGVVSSVLGVVVGIALGQVALWVASTQDLGVPLPRTIAPTWHVVVVPVAVGTLVTVLSALVPARVATRVAPLAALRPADAPVATRGAGRVRLVLSVVAAVVGETVGALSEPVDGVTRTFRVVDFDVTLPGRHGLIGRLRLPGDYRDLKQAHPGGDPAGFLAEARWLKEQRRAIEAIKLIRQHTGLGLKEAKDFYDNL